MPVSSAFLASNISSCFCATFGLGTWRCTTVRGSAFGTGLGTCRATGRLSVSHLGLGHWGAGGLGDWGTGGARMAQLVAGSTLTRYVVGSSPTRTDISAFLQCSVTGLSKALVFQAVPVRLGIYKIPCHLSKTEGHCLPVVGSSWFHS